MEEWTTETELKDGITKYTTYRGDRISNNPNFDISQNSIEEINTIYKDANGIILDKYPSNS